MASEYDAVPNLDLPRPGFDVPALTSEELQVSSLCFKTPTSFLTCIWEQTVILHQTVREFPQLVIQFPFPDTQHSWASKVSVWMINPQQIT